MKQKEQKESDFERLVEEQKQTIYSVCYLFFHDRVMFFTLLITGLIVIPPIGRLTGKRVKKRYDELDEEIDELLKE